MTFAGNPKLGHKKSANAIAQIPLAQCERLLLTLAFETKAATPVRRGSGRLPSVTEWRRRRHQNQVEWWPAPIPPDVDAEGKVPVDPQKAF